jgi:hypothetical protein
MKNSFEILDYSQIFGQEFANFQCLKKNIFSLKKNHITL